MHASSAWPHVSPPAPDTSPAELAAAMLDLLRSCMSPGGSGIWDLLEEAGLTFPQVKMLMILEGCDQLSVKEVSERVGMSLPNASRTVEALVRLAYLDRREDPTDRRMKRIAMTPAGSEIVQRFQDARFQGLRTWAETVPEDRRAALFAVLQTLPSSTRKGA